MAAMVVAIRESVATVAVRGGVLDRRAEGVVLTQGSLPKP